METITKYSLSHKRVIDSVIETSLKSKKITQKCIPLKPYGLLSKKPNLTSTYTQTLPKASTNSPTRKSISISKYANRIAVAYTLFMVYMAAFHGSYPLYYWYKDSIFVISSKSLIHVHTASSLLMWGLYAVLSKMEKTVYHRKLGYVYYLNYALVFLPSAVKITLQLKQESELGTLISKLTTMEQCMLSAGYTILSFLYIIKGNVKAHKIFNDMNMLVTCFIVVHRMVGWVFLTATGSDFIARMAGDLIPFYFFAVKSGVHIRFIFNKSTIKLMGPKWGSTAEKYANFFVFRWILYLALFHVYRDLKPDPIQT